MKSHYRVAVIGGGVTGCSVLYHLGKMGWNDIVLLERSELTSGSSWHAAGVIHTINADPNIARLQGYTLKLYEEIEQLSGQSCGVHRPGGIYLASTSERLDYLKQERAKARYMGLDSEFITMKEVRELNPLVETQHFTGALFEPADGHVDPAGVTQAYAKAARYYGAEVHRNTPVENLQQRPDGTWDVITPAGSTNAEIVVSAAGLWAREVGRMAGVDLPLLPMEHQYLITEPIKEIEELGREIAVTIDYEGNAYTRQEGKGLLIGTYEPGCKPWSVRGTPKNFGHELLQPDLDRFVDRMEIAYERMPTLASTGIKNITNGPFTFAPDGNPLIGPVPGMRNFYVACAVMAGFCQGGGVGLCLAEWIIEGEPSIDVFAMDVARFGDHATGGYTIEKVKENYSRRFMITYPNEELPAARPWRTTPIYDRLKRKGAVFGASFGLEHALWFAPDGVEPREIPTFRRSNAFEYVAQECRAVRENVGVLEIANFAKYEISGADAARWLDGILANHMPKTNRLLLSPMLSPKGRLAGDLTVGKLGDERFYIFGSGVMQAAHMRWFLRHLPDSGVTVRNRSNELHGLAIAGPKSRDLLSRLTLADVSRDAFRFLELKEFEVAGIKCIVARISFTGELGYEIYCPPEYQLALYDAITTAGEDTDIKLFGGRALFSLRLEKNYGIWTYEFRPDFTAAEAGLDAFIDFGKAAGFIGKEPALAERAAGPKRRLIALVVDADDADVNHDEPIFHNGECVGYVTSGGYAHYTKNSVAMGYVPAELAKEGAEFEIEILGDKRLAKIQLEPLYDPKRERMRA